MNIPIEVSDPALKPWIGDDKIIACNWSDKCANLVVITKSEEDEDYCLLRAFLLGGTVHVSVDLNNRSADELIYSLLDSRE